jgi:hypothetical protein
MDFIVKDLMISVLPLRPSPTIAGLAGCDAGCTAKSDCGTCTGMTRCPGGCTGGTPHPTDLYEQVSNPAALALLKQQLQETLAAVEARERVVHEAMQPRSATEVEILRVHLEAALEELRGRAADIRGQQTTGESQQG